MLVSVWADHVWAWCVRCMESACMCVCLCMLSIKCSIYTHIEHVHSTTIHTRSTTVQHVSITKCTFAQTHISDSANHTHSLLYQKNTNISVIHPRSCRLPTSHHQAAQTWWRGCLICLRNKNKVDFGKSSSTEQIVPKCHFFLVLWEWRYHIYVKIAIDPNWVSSTLLCSTSYVPGGNSSLVLVGMCCWEFDVPIQIPTFHEKVT